MSKNLTEVKSQDEIVVPKKKRFVRTRKAGAEKMKFTLIMESDKKAVDELVRIYKEDPLVARVKFFNNGGPTFSRLVLFEQKNGDFELSDFTVKVGISITNRMYTTQKKVRAIYYKGGKFWYRSFGAKAVKPLLYGDLISFIAETEGYGAYSADKPLNKSKIFQLFYDRFHWFKTVLDAQHNTGINFNTIISKKLFKLKDIYKYLFRVPYNTGLELLKSKLFNNFRNQGTSMKVWHEMVKVLDGPEHLTIEMMNDYHFLDSCKMARTLGEKINCRWGNKRLKEMHDIWAMKITNILLASELEYNLDIWPIFITFAKHSGFQVLVTNKDLLREGMMQHHCVGTYINRVNNGECAIFHVEGYTLQISKGYIGDDDRTIVRVLGAPVDGFDFGRLPETKGKKLGLLNQQFRGKYNQDAPQELVDLVAEKLRLFNESEEFKKGMEENSKFVPTVKRDSNQISAVRPNIMDGDRYAGVGIEGEQIDMIGIFDDIPYQPLVQAPAMYDVDLDYGDFVGEGVVLEMAPRENNFEIERIEDL